MFFTPQRFSPLPDAEDVQMRHDDQILRLSTQKGKAMYTRYAKAIRLIEAILQTAQTYKATLHTLEKEIFTAQKALHTLMQDTDNPEWAVALATQSMAEEILAWHAQLMQLALPLSAPALFKQPRLLGPPLPLEESIILHRVRVRLQNLKAELPRMLKTLNDKLSEQHAGILQMLQQLEALVTSSQNKGEPLTPPLSVETETSPPTLSLPVATTVLRSLSSGQGSMTPPTESAVNHEALKKPEMDSPATHMQTVLRLKNIGMAALDALQGAMQNARNSLQALQAHKSQVPIETFCREVENVLPLIWHRIEAGQRPSDDLKKLAALNALSMEILEQNCQLQLLPTSPQHHPRQRKLLQAQCDALVRYLEEPVPAINFSGKNQRQTSISDSNQENTPRKKASVLKQP